MNEQELKEKISEASKDIKPLVDVIVNALCEAHKAGFLSGLELGTGIKIANDAMMGKVHFNINLKR